MAHMLEQLSKESALCRCDGLLWSGTKDIQRYFLAVNIPVVQGMLGASVP